MRRRSTWGWIRWRLFGISPEEASFVRRGFASPDPAARSRLEHIGRTFIRGYLAGLDEPSGAVAARLDAVEPELRGFAYEGAAMALALLDGLTPWRRDRLRRFSSGAGARHVYMCNVGAGWAMARLGGRVDRVLAQLDPLLGWLAVDGCGFHEGYFHWPATVRARLLPAWLPRHARPVFDQGLGRSLWFVEGACSSRIVPTIAAFTSDRQADLWSGVGLAASYAGGVGPTTLERVRAAAGPYRDHLAQGAAFAAKARLRAGNPAPHTELACQVFTAVSATEAAAVVDAALDGLPEDVEAPRYERWRERVRAHFAREAVTC